MIVDDRRHHIPVVIDYRLAHTIIKGMRGWLEELEKVLDTAVRKGGSKIPCRRKYERRVNGGRRKGEPDGT